MLVGAGTSDGRGTVLRYASDDLRAWTYVGPVLSVDDVDPSAGGDGPMWECPQLLRFGDTDVLIVSVLDRLPGIRPSHVMAFVGRLHDDRFAIDHAQQLGMGPRLLCAGNSDLAGRSALAPRLDPGGPPLRKPRIGRGPARSPCLESCRSAMVAVFHWLWQQN